jgi:tetratricopeptide (TPR) repeat protein
VYLARELKHDRMVAVKVLHPVLAASLQAERFLREIDIIARLAHPNILPLLDSGRAGELLYFVTPYVPGESLRQRLERERKLPMGDAVRIVREVAEALDYAHRQGVVHRDVKPENILLADGHALVADFGIARALSAAADDRLTTVGLAPGTPRYMSPEQAGGAARVDGRSDIYSLACVLFELASGGPPFTGETAQDVARKHVAAPVPSLRSAASVLPRELDLAVAKAMAKAPGDRYATAAEFANALGVAAGAGERWDAAWRRRHWSARRGLAWGVTGMGALLIVAWIARSSSESPLARGVSRLLAAAGLREATLDSSVYVILPLDASGVAIAPAAVDLLRSGLQRWRDITIEDQSRVDEAIGDRGRAVTASDRRRRAVAALGAGRYVDLGATRLGDSVEVTGTLYATATGERLFTSVVRVGSTQRSAAAVIEALAESLLFREGLLHGRADRPAGTSSMRARQAYLSGHRALIEGQLRQADAAFVEATRLDAGYPQALVWLATVRTWIADRPWTQYVNQAMARRHLLRGTDSLLLEGLLALAAGDPQPACVYWEHLTESAPNDFTSWFGLGNCLRRDGVVVRSSGPERWRFRSSYHRAVSAYERAFRLQPSILRGFGRGGLSTLHAIMFTSGARLRDGRALAPDTLRFGGYPLWQSDTLAFVALANEEARLAPLPDAVGEAIQHQRLRFRDIAALWRTEFPTSSDAAEAVAVAAEMLGDEAALDTLRRARDLAVDPDDRLRIAGTEVWFRVKFSLPSNVSGLRAAKALADSLLRRVPDTSASPLLLGSLAALTGRAGLAAKYARKDGSVSAFPALARTAPALLSFASLGGPAESLSTLERSVQAALLNVSAASRQDATALWLTRPAFLAFPEYRFESLARVGETGLRLGNVVAAAFAADTLAVRQLLSEFYSARRWVRPADVMADALLTEASALMWIGDEDAAIRQLDQTLGALRLTASRDLIQIYRAGALVRAMVLRADLAHRRGDAENARRWARAVDELWTDGDAFLQPTVKRMRTLAAELSAR